jgi:hypothetical protein
MNAARRLWITVLFAQAILGVCMASSMQAHPAAAPAINRMPAGLVGYWRLDEGVGTTAFDFSGKGAHGEILGGATWE